MFSISPIDSLLDILSTEDLQANTEAFLYCMGAIKFISGNARIINEMLNKGTVEILVQLMKQINEINESDARFSSSGHLLVQVSVKLLFHQGNSPGGWWRTHDLCASSGTCATLAGHRAESDQLLWTTTLWETWLGLLAEQHLHLTALLGMLLQHAWIQARQSNFIKCHKSVKCVCFNCCFHNRVLVYGGG